MTARFAELTPSMAYMVLAVMMHYGCRNDEELFDALVREAYMRRCPGEMPSAMAKELGAKLVEFQKLWGVPDAEAAARGESAQVEAVTVDEDDEDYWTERVEARVSPKCASALRAIGAREKVTRSDIARRALYEFAAKHQSQERRAA